MKALLFILHFAHLGTDTLPTQKVLEASIDSLFAQKANIDINEFQTTNKYDWMKWLLSGASAQVHGSWVQRLPR
jgi:hypothetical protein